MNRLNRTQLLSSLALLSGLALGCGDDGGSGVASGKKLSSLSDSEAQALCKEFANKAAEVSTSGDELGCTVRGIYSEASDAGECEAVRDACVADLEGLEDEQEQDDCADVKTEEAPACASEVTVGEFRKCMEAVLDSALAPFEGLSCDSDASDVPTEVQEPELPAACNVIADKCPELLPS